MFHLFFFGQTKQVTKISEVQESMTLKIAKVEKSVLTVEEVISTKISAVENSMANIREQIKIEVEQCMKIQPTQIDVYKRQHTHTHTHNISLYFMLLILKASYISIFQVYQRFFLLILFRNIPIKYYQSI